MLVTSVSSRLCAWEFDLASEALAKRACCTSCGGRVLTPVTRKDAEKRSVPYWCSGCAGLRLYRVVALRRIRKPLLLHKRHPATPLSREGDPAGCHHSR